MNYEVKQSTTTYALVFLMVDSTDHVTGKTGLTPTVTLSKNGGSFASPSGAVSEIANGWYKVAGNATDNNTLGPLILHATGTAADPTDVVYTVVADLPGVAQTGDAYARLGAPAGASVSADVAAVKSDTGAIKTKTDSLTFTVAGHVDANTLKLGGTTQTARDIGASVLLSNGTGTGQLKLASGYVAMTWADIGLPTSVVNLTGTTMSVVNAVTGNVGGNVVGSVGSLTGMTASDVGSIKGVTDKLLTTLEVASGSPGDYRFAADALVNAPTGSGGSAPSAATIAAAVWDEALSGHATAGTAGKIVYTNLDATVGTRATQTSVDTVAGYVDTEVAAIKAKTDNLPTDPADASDIAASFSTVNSTLATIAGYIDTEVAAIKAKTDNLPASPAATSDIPTAAAIADAVWDEATSGHTTSGTTGAALNDTDLRGSRTVIRGTVGGSPTTTTMTPSAITPAGAVADQFKGRILVFDNDTSTAALRGQATDITANTSASLPAFTFTALTTAPSSGDSFSIL